MLTHALAVVLRPAHDLGNVGRQTPRVSLFNTFIKNDNYLIFTCGDIWR
jgi:hypothetical protein